MSSKSTVGSQKSQFMDIVKKTRDSPLLYRPSQNLTSLRQKYQQSKEYHDRSSDDMKGFLTHVQAFTSSLLLTFERYTRLSTIIQEHSLFVDSSNEINRLTADIKSSLTKLAQALAAIEQAANQSNPEMTSLFSLFNQSSQHAQHDHSHQVKRLIVNSLRNRLTLLTKEFGDLLQVHAQIVQADASRKNRYEDEENTSNTRLYVPQFTARKPPVPPLPGLRPPHQQPSNPQVVPTPTPISSGANQADILGFSQHPTPQPVAPTPYQTAVAPPVHEIGGSQVRQRTLGTTLRRPHNPALENQSGYGNQSNTRGGYQNELPDFSALVDQTLVRKQQDTAFINQNDAYYQARAKDVHQIHSTIEDIAVMYGQLNEMVHQQEETTLRIDANINEMALHVEAGQEAIFDYYENTSNNQWLLIKIFIVIIVFALFFITVIS